MDVPDASLTVAPVPVARRRGFRMLWSASTVSSLGDGMRIVAFPLMAASLTRNPSAIATVFAAGFIPWPLFGLAAACALATLLTPYHIRLYGVVLEYGVFVASLSK